MEIRDKGKCGMTSIYSCHSDTSGTAPRGRPSESWVQEGWRTIQRDVPTREPIMVKVRTDWAAMDCGALQQAGYADLNCVGCVNLSE